MDLYFSPLACSMATRIAFYEAGITGNFIGVDTQAKKLADGSDFFAINPMGQVPVLRTDDGELLTESPVVLQYVADQFPETGLAPRDGMPGRVPGRGVGAVGKWPAGATAKSLALIHSGGHRGVPG